MIGRSKKKQINGYIYWFYKLLFFGHNSSCIKPKIQINAKKLLWLLQQLVICLFIYFNSV